MNRNKFKITFLPYYDYISIVNRNFLNNVFTNGFINLAVVEIVVLIFNFIQNLNNYSRILKVIILKYTVCPFSLYLYSDCVIIGAGKTKNFAIPVLYLFSR